MPDQRRPSIPGDVQLFRSLLIGPRHITVAINGAKALDMLFQRGHFRTASDQT